MRASSKQLVTLVSWSLFSYIYIHVHENNKSFSYIYRNMRVILFFNVVDSFCPERDRPVNTALLLRT